MIIIWCTIYTAYPNLLHTDQGSLFTPKKRKQLAERISVKLCLSGATTHSSLRIGEQYYEPLRRKFYKIQFYHPTFHQQYTLQIGVQALNTTKGEVGFVTPHLVFGIIP